MAPLGPLPQAHAFGAGTATRLIDSTATILSFAVSFSVNFLPMVVCSFLPVLVDAFLCPTAVRWIATCSTTALWERVSQVDRIQLIALCGADL
jgi:hypothetical protein